MPRCLHRLALWLSLALTCVSLLGPAARAEVAPQRAAIVQLLQQEREEARPVVLRREVRRGRATPVRVVRAPAPVRPALTRHGLFLQHCALLR